MQKATYFPQKLQNWQFSVIFALILNLMFEVTGIGEFRITGRHAWAAEKNLNLNIKSIKYNVEYSDLLYIKCWKNILKSQRFSIHTLTGEEGQD